MDNNVPPKKKVINPFWTPFRRFFDKYLKPISLKLRTSSLPIKKGAENALKEMRYPQEKEEETMGFLSPEKKLRRPIKKHKLVIIYSCIGALLILSLASWRVINRYTSKTKYYGEGYDPRPTVEADIVTTHALTRRIKAVGTLKATDSAVIKAEIAGVISAINFKDGVKVESGTPLLKLDDAMLRAQFEEAQTEYNLKKATFKRNEELFKQKFISAQEHDRIRAEMEAAEARVKLAKARLDQATILAPFTGYIGLRDISVGSYVQPGQELITMVNLDPVKVDFKVPEYYLKELQLGQSATVEVDGFENTQFFAKIEAIDPKIDPQSHSIQVRASIDNLDTLLRPGLFANVTLALGEDTDALMIPESAVDRSGDDEFVYVLRDIRGQKTAIKTIVITGSREDGMVEIREGINPGNEIIVAGHVKIRDGYPVRVVERPTNNPAAIEEQNSNDNVTQ